MDLQSSADNPMAYFMGGHGFPAAACDMSSFVPPSCPLWLIQVLKIPAARHAAADAHGHNPVPSVATF